MLVKFVVGSLLRSERFFSGYSGFPISSKTHISKFQFDQESGRRRTTLWMCYLQIIIYLFIYLQLTKFTKMNVWVYYLYWSNKYPVGPDDPMCRVATMKRNQTEIDEEKFPVVPDENQR